MSRDERFIELWNDYLEGELDKAGIIELQRLLANDERLTQMAADNYRTHRLLGLLAQDCDSQQDDFVRETLNRLPAKGDQFVGAVLRRIPPGSSATARSRVARWSMRIAAAVLLLAGVYLLSSRPDREIVKITELSGPMQWTGDGGQVTLNLEVGQSLCGGAFESLSADSWVELEFLDGSTVTMSGQTSLTISEIDQKELYLRHGRLSASVTRQSADRPMLIYTPMAELKVVGTQFNLDAESSRTMLAVNEGLVRLKRLTDGEVVDVPANHQTVASVEEHNGLEVTIRGTAVHSWCSDLAKDATRGKWWSDLHALGVKLKRAVISGKITEEEAGAKYRAAANLSEDAGILYATPWLAKHFKLGTKAGVLYLAALSVTRGQTSPIVADAGSRFRIVGQVESSANVTFGITTLAPIGGLAGKYYAVRTIEVSEPDGSFDIEVPLLEFQPVAVKKGLAESPSGQELADWWCITTGKDVKLAIMRVELLSAMSP